MTLIVQDDDLALHHGDCLDVLRTLPDRSVHICATSPPFFRLRDYNAAGQIGLEETPDEWCDKLVEVFREVRRVLRDDGTLWVEIGSSYSSSTIHSDAHVLRDDLTDDEFAYVLSELAQALPGVRQGDASPKSDVPELLPGNEGEDAAGDLSREAV